MESYLVSLIDLFGRPVTIKYFGRDQFSSRFGAICSLLFFGFLGWALYNGSNDLFNRQNPVAMNSEGYIEDPPQMLLSIDTFPIAVQLYSSELTGYVSFIDESIYTVEFIYSTYRVAKDENGNDIAELKDYPLDKEICTPSHFGELADAFSKFPLNTFYCIAKNQPEIQQIFIQGSDSSPLYDLLSVRLLECNNETSTCADEDVRKAYLSGAWISLYHPNLAINPNNYTRPDTRSRDSYTTMLSRDNYKETYLRLSQVELITDAGWIIASPQAKTYIKANAPVEYLQFEQREDKALITCIFEPSRSTFQWSRTYKTVQEVLAEVGGLANVALVVLYTITTPYLALKFRESLINELFDIYPLPPKRKKASKKRKNNKQGSIDKPIKVQEEPQNKIKAEEKGDNERQNDYHIKLNFSGDNLINKSDLNINKVNLTPNTESIGTKAKMKPSSPSLRTSPSELYLNFMNIILKTIIEAHLFPHTKENFFLQAKTKEIRILII